MLIPGCRILSVNHMTWDVMIFGLYLQLEVEYCGYTDLFNFGVLSSQMKASFKKLVGTWLNYEV